MTKDDDIFKGKSFADLLKDIYENSRKKDRQIKLLIAQLEPLVKNLNDVNLVSTSLLASINCLFSSSVNANPPVSLFAAFKSRCAIAAILTNWSSFLTETSKYS